MQQIGNKKVIYRRTRDIIYNTFDYMRITFPFEPLTIHFCDVSRSFVSATKYENTSITVTAKMNEFPKRSKASISKQTNQHILKAFNKIKEITHGDMET
jgi:hypothetical protein